MTLLDGALLAVGVAAIVFAVALTFVLIGLVLRERQGRLELRKRIARLERQIAKQDDEIEPSDPFVVRRRKQ